MEPREYETMRSVEDAHWWYQGLWELTGLWLRLHLASGRAPRILDAGCGTGGLLARLSAQYPAMAGVDLAPAAVAHCRERGLPAVARARVEALPFGAESFDAVVSNDVIYHRLAHEGPALGEFRRVLRPGGLLLMNLPAFESLRGTHDLAVHTRRRFTRADLGLLLQESGFAPVRLTYRNTLLFPAAWLVRKLRRGAAAPGGEAGPSDVEMPSAPVNFLLRSILALENLFLRAVDLPLGLSLFCVARKTADARPGPESRGNAVLSGTESAVSRLPPVP